MGFPGAGAIFWYAPPCSGPSPELKPLPVAVLRGVAAYLFPPVNEGFAGVPTHSECSSSARRAYPELALFFWCTPPCSGPLPELKPLPVAALRRTVGVLFPPVNAGLAGVPTHSECSPPGRWAFPELALFFWCTPPCSGPSPELKPLPVAAPSNRRTPQTFLMEYFQASSRFLHTHAL